MLYYNYFESAPFLLREPKKMFCVIFSLRIKFYPVFLPILKFEVVNAPFFTFSLDELDVFFEFLFAFKI